MSRSVQTAAVDQWDLMSPRSINYRSLRPILRLAGCPLPAVQYWASWALANLCSVYRMCLMSRCFFLPL